MRLSLERAFLKAKDWVTPAKDHSINAILFSPEAQDGERLYLFQIPTAAEAQKSGKGLRLFGGMEEKGDKDLLHTLQRELIEEIVGEGAEKLTGNQKKAMRIIEDAVATLRNKPQSVPEPYVHMFWPNRANPKQDRWWKSETTVIGIPVSREDLLHLANVAQITAALENKEVYDVEVLPERELTLRLRDAKTMAYSNERAGLVHFLKALAPQDSMGIAPRFTPSPASRLDLRAQNG